LTVNCCKVYSKRFAMYKANNFTFLSEVIKDTCSEKYTLP